MGCDRGMALLNSAPGRSTWRRLRWGVRRVGQGDGGGWLELSVKCFGRPPHWVTMTRLSCFWTTTRVSCSLLTDMYKRDLQDDIAALSLVQVKMVIVFVVDILFLEQMVGLPTSLSLT
jgi:hypothetical protein